MSIISELIPALAAAFGATAIAAAFSALMRPLLLEQKDRREKARAKLKDQIRKKLQGGVKLEAYEVADIGRGLNLSAAQSTNALYDFTQRPRIKLNTTNLNILFQKLIARRHLNHYRKRYVLRWLVCP